MYKYDEDKFDVESGNSFFEPLLDYFRAKELPYDLKISPSFRFNWIYVWKMPPEALDQFEAEDSGSGSGSDNDSRSNESVSAMDEGENGADNLADGSGEADSEQEDEEEEQDDSGIDIHEVSDNDVQSDGEDAKSLEIAIVKGQDRSCIPSQQPPAAQLYANSQCFS